MKDILLINFNGLVYGIWGSDVLSIEDLPVLHSLPATPSYVAGVAIMHDRTVMLADLSVCIGHVPMKRTGTGHALLLSDTESFAGFAVEEEIRHASIANDSVHPMPEYLTTPVVDSCVLVHSILVPVINISVIYTRVQKVAHEPAAAQFSWPGSSGMAVPGEKIRLFEISDGIFSASAAGMRETVEKPGPLSRLFVAPPCVAGMVFHNGRILPVFDLLQRLSLQERGQGETMLVAELRNSPFGFLIHGDEGFVKHEDVSIKELPPLVQSGWIRSALEHAGEIVPLLDLEEILRIGPGMAEEKQLALRYTPDSGFIDMFGSEDVTVVEFSLLGQRHALPKVEVIDSMGFKPYREIPKAPEIAIGVAVYNEELLPVLDLAMVFGRRSLVTPEWRMLHVKNGDFQALVITESIFGERQLPVDIQRDVPIVLPHNVVYGCYPDVNSVRLILNVEALAVYFEKTLVQELLPAMTPEMKQAPSEIVPSLLEEPLVAASRAAVEDPSEGGHVPQEAEAFQANETEKITVVSDRVKVPEVAEVLRYSAETEEVRKLEEISEYIKEHKEVNAASRGGETKPDQVPTASSQEPIGEPGLNRIEAAIGEVVKNDNIQRKEIVAIPELAPTDDEPPAEEQKIEELQALPVEEIINQEPQEQVGAVHEEPSVVEPEISMATEKTEPIFPQSSPELEQEVLKEEREPLSAPIVLKQVHENKEILSLPISRNRRFAYGVIGGLLVLMLFVGVLFWQAGVGKKDKTSKPAAVSAEATKKKTKSKTTQKNPMDSLVFEVPADSAVESGVYVVNEGDTLWDISERFTGDPFKYPQIAGENRILDPDLIFPEQKIIIKKKEK